MLLVAPVVAEKPPKGESGKSHGHHEKKQASSRHEHEEDWERNQPIPGYSSGQPVFNEQQRRLAKQYYVDEYQKCRCPPGLEKKHKGCLPPGQAKRWAIGRPLPRDVTYYDLPDHVLRQIGYPPSGYRYVRVASDLLMITTGSAMVVDAIADLNGMR